MKAVILAAGKGTRLYPVTLTIAKPLLPLANRPTLFYAFDRLKEMGVTDICIVVGENEPQMRAALGVPPPSTDRRASRPARETRPSIDVIGRWSSLYMAGAGN